MTEVSIHRVLDHPNIVKFEEFFEDSYFYYIVLELCTDEVMPLLSESGNFFEKRRDVQSRTNSELPQTTY